MKVQWISSDKSMSSSLLFLFLVPPQHDTSRQFVTHKVPQSQGICLPTKINNTSNTNISGQIYYNMKQSLSLLPSTGRVT